MKGAIMSFGNLSVTIGNLWVLVQARILDRFLAVQRQMGRAACPPPRLTGFSRVLPITSTPGSELLDIVVAQGTRSALCSTTLAGKAGLGVIKVDAPLYIYVWIQP